MLYQSFLNLGTYANYNTVNIVKDAKNKENTYKYVAYYWR